MMMVNLLFLFGLSFQLEEKEALLLMEEIELRFPGDFTQSYRRNIWIGKHRIRTDIEHRNLSLIYDLRLRSLFVLNHEKGEYFIVHSGRDKKLSRSPFFGLTSQENGKLLKTTPLAVGTGKKKKISGWECYEYRLNYPKQYEITTSVWTTSDAVLFEKGALRKLWYAAIGPQPPIDVRQIVNTLIRDINGVPIQTVSTITQQGMVVTTTSTIVHIQYHNNIDPQFFNEPKNYKFAHWKGEDSILANQ